MQTIWILIANASEARLFEAKKTAKNMRLIREFYHPESREKVVDLVTGGLGRYRKINSLPTSSYQEPSNPKQVEAERFAHELAEKLNEGRTRNRYKNLILIAPSHFQGLLNKFCNMHVKNLISITLHKDYTKIKQHDLPNYLNGKISLPYAA